MKFPDFMWTREPDTLSDNFYVGDKIIGFEFNGQQFFLTY